MTDLRSKLNHRTPEVTPEVTPDVDAVNMSQERVDETAKREHEPWQSVQCTCGGTIYFKHTKREWVGLTEAEIEELAKWADKHAAPWHLEFARAVEAKLKEKNYESS